MSSIPSALFPSLVPLFTFLGLEVIPEKSMDFFADIVRRVIELRNEEEGKNEVSGEGCSVKGTFRDHRVTGALNFHKI